MAPEVERRRGRVEAKLVEGPTIVVTPDGDVEAERGQVVVRDVEGVRRVYDPFSFLLRYCSTGESGSDEFVEEVVSNVEPREVEEEEWINRFLWLVYCLKPGCGFSVKGLGWKNRSPCSVAHPAMYHSVDEGHFVDRVRIDVSPCWGQQSLDLKGDGEM